MKNSYDVLFIGGHHTSALPLISIFTNNNYSVGFIGHKYASKINTFESSEYKEITSLNIDYYNLKSSKFYNVPGLLKYFDIFLATLRSFVFLIKNRPKIIISFGGYLAVPVVLAGFILRIKIVTHEQTAVIGLANKVISNFADTIFLSWSNKSLENKSNCILVGIPLRQELLNIPRKKINKKNINSVLFVQGGKQGSHLLNTFVFENIEYLSSIYTRIYHQTGKTSVNNDHEISENLMGKYSNYVGFDYKYGEDYSSILNQSTFIISRSGAHITYELCYLKVPTVFVPISWSSHNEQYYNAIAAKSYLPCEVVEEDTLNLVSFKVAYTNIINNLGSKYKTVNINAAEMMYSYITKKYF